MILLALALATQAQTIQTGLWSYDTVYNTGAHGALTVTHDASGWKARIAGHEMSFTPAGDSVRFGSVDSSGAFRGAFTIGRQTIDGFWVQPHSVWYDQYFTTPLELPRSGAETWRGTVTPLEDRLTLYLAIQRGADSALVAVFRHPQANAFGRGLRYGVSTSGDSVYFVAPANQRRPEVRIAGAYDRASQTITIKWPILDQPTVLRPQAPEKAVSFYPRLPRGAKYVYRPPPRLNDGWDVGRLRDVGFEETALARLVQSIVDTDPAGPQAPLIHSMLVARQGRLVLEEYFFGSDRTQPHDTRSLGKTFGSVMLGGAMLEGDPIAPESLLVPTSDDPRKARITLANVLTHTTGLACDDNDDNSPGNEDVMQSQTKQPDWWRYTLDLPMVNDPGTHAAYCSGGMNLTGYMLTRATRTWLPALFERTVARPLGFGRWYWNLMPTQEGYQGGGARLLPRDLLKIGVAYLNGGEWHGKRIVSREWTARSTVNQVAPGVGTDGYAWHLGNIKVGERAYREYEGNGNGGQFLIVVPEVDLAVVFTAGDYLDYGVWGQFRNVLVADMIRALR
jgi:CubicO group peptidase (beta-lactamase class C family)